MAELEKWIREYQLVFSGPDEKLVISSADQRDPLDISFDVSYDPKKNMQGTMSLKIFGLKESNVAGITKSGVKVWLKVGYRGVRPGETVEYTTLFTGGIRSVNVESFSGKHVTNIRAITSRAGNKPIQAKFIDGVTNFVRIIEYIRELKKSVPELIIDRAEEDIARLTEDEISKSEAEKRELGDRTLLNDLVVGSLTVNNTGMDGLQEILDTFNIRSMVVNDTLYLVRAGGQAENVNAIQASLGENLLTPPRRRLDNMEVAPDSANSKEMYEFTMLLEPDLLPNSIVAASHIRTDTGNVEPIPTVIRATEVKHSGRYRSKTWYTSVAGTISSDYLDRKAPIVSVLYDIENIYREPTEDKTGGEINSSFNIV